MRIVFVAQPRDAMPAPGSSIGLWIGEVSRVLAAQHEVHVLSRREPGRPDRETRDGVVHHRVSTRPDGLLARAFRAAESLAQRLTGRRPDWFYRHYYFGALYYASFAIRAALRARRLDADAVVIPNYSQLLTWFRRFGAGRRVLVMHCDWLAELPLASARRRVRDADVITGCSGYIVENVRRRLPEAAERCHVLYNASRVPEAGPEAARARRHALGLADDVPVLLFVGRVTPEKGVHVLVEAMAEVVRSHPKAVLLVAGALAVNPPSPQAQPSAEEARWEALKPGYREHLEALAEPLGERIRLLGSVPHGEVLDLYRACDVFVHPALWNEPFGMILTEAMLSARPVVATRTGGIPEIVRDGETGRLVPPDDVAALSAAIRGLLDDPARRRAWGEAGRKRALEHFTWERTAATLLDVIRRS